ncbi:DUF2779 domain-containing protein [Crocinitomicaceae bacterium]|nr:DUF2779 domain-containing protein [Crocinitomicaceae bacterium]
MEKHILSKSTFIRGVQCEKSLYLNKHARNLRDEISPEQLAVFSQGTNVGELAQGLFPGGVDCTPESYYNFQESVERTHAEIAKGTKVIYEAAFQFNGVLAALDILVLEEDGWHAYEVKSSTKVSETYEMDASIQYYAITNSGIDLKDISIVHINNQYVKNGELNLNELFTVESVRERVLENIPGISNRVSRFKSILEEKQAPEKGIGEHCDSPYTCDFHGHCWKHIPEYSVFDIAWLRKPKKFELYDQGILNVEDVPDDYPLNDNQWMQVQCTRSQESLIDQKAIREFVNDLVYPIYHLDFETFATAVPVFDGSRPYQQLVFQYSLHIEHENGDIEHREYLAEADGTDPRIAFIDRMIEDCGTSGSVLVYNRGFESGKIEDLIEFSPKHTIALQGIIDRIVDLMVPFRERWYYTPEMQGSYSIKKVLPALVPELSYENLEIKGGGVASSTFSQMIQGTFKGDVEETRRNLLAYCKMDTLAMVEILKKLKI